MQITIEIPDDIAAELEAVISEMEGEKERRPDGTFTKFRFPNGIQDYAEEAVWAQIEDLSTRHPSAFQDIKRVQREIAAERATIEQTWRDRMRNALRPTRPTQ